MFICSFGPGPNTWSPRPRSSSVPIAGEHNRDCPDKKEFDTVRLTDRSSDKLPRQNSRGAESVTDSKYKITNIGSDGIESVTWRTVRKHLGPCELL